MVLIVRWFIVPRWHSLSTGLTRHQAAALVHTHQEVITRLKIVGGDMAVDPTTDPRHKLDMTTQRHFPVTLNTDRQRHRQTEIDRQTAVTTDKQSTHQPARTLRSSSQLLLCQLVTGINFQSTAPAVWNSLSSVSKSSATITTFKASEKFYL